MVRRLTSALWLSLWVGCVPLTNGADSDAGDAGASDAGASAKEAGTPSAWCTRLGDRMERCEGTRMCTSGFNAWCTKQSTTNSAAFEKADLQCLSDCNNAARTECRYRQYEPNSMSAAQRSLVRDYCATCGTPGCEASLMAYDASLGLAGVTDAFIAVWELSDAVTEEIRTNCTGTALKVTDGDCPRAFGQCASGPYLNALPECK